MKISERENQSETVVGLKTQFISPDQVRGLEQGFTGNPVDRILILNAAWIAGGGPGTQLGETIQESKLLAQTQGIPIQYIGTALDIGIETIATIPQVSGIENRFRAAEEAVTSALRTIAQNSSDEVIGVISIGYTAYGPYAVKRALRTIYEESGKQLQAVVVNFDSSYPDKDRPSPLVNRFGQPMDRFNPNGYKSDDNMLAYQVIVNPIGVDVRTGASRAPEGTTCISTSLPFSERTVNYLKKLRSLSTSAARKQLVQILSEKGAEPKLLEALSSEGTIFIPFVASSDYFDPTSIGAWMTQDQYEDFQFGMSLFLTELTALSQQLQRQIIITGVDEFVEFAKNLGFTNVFSRPQLSRPEHIIYMKAADVTIQRTTQANSFAEAALAGAPCIVMTIPGKNYMNVDAMDTQWRQKGGLQMDTSSYQSEQLQEWITAITTDPSYSEKLVKLQEQLMDNVTSDPNKNFFSIIKRLFGIESI